jgi:hypothetical protein
MRAGSTTASSQRSRGASRRWPTKSSTKGATTRLPPMSPSHHTRKVEPTSSQDSSPPRPRLATPMVALTRVLTIAASTTSANTSRTRRRALSNFARCSR